MGPSLRNLSENGDSSPAAGEEVRWRGGILGAHTLIPALSLKGEGVFGQPPCKVKCTVLIQDQSLGFHHRGKEVTEI
jgi:hypothetical protein